MSSINISVIMSGRDPLPLTLPLDAKACQLRSLISQAYQIPTSNQTLIFNHKRIQGSETLVEQGIGDDAKIYLCQRKDNYVTCKNHTSPQSPVLNHRACPTPTFTPFQFCPLRPISSFLQNKFSQPSPPPSTFAHNSPNFFRPPHPFNAVRRPGIPQLQKEEHRYRLCETHPEGNRTMLDHFRANRRQGMFRNWLQRDEEGLIKDQPEESEESETDFAHDSESDGRSAIIESSPLAHHWKQFTQCISSICTKPLTNPWCRSPLINPSPPTFVRPDPTTFSPVMPNFDSSHLTPHNNHISRTPPPPPRQRSEERGFGSVLFPLPPPVPSDVSFNVFLTQQHTSPVVPKSPETEKRPPMSGFGFSLSVGRMDPFKGKPGKKEENQEEKHDDVKGD
ncbi:hypothetical protein BLNAU_2725 [Blattamonas nauphoetae]|uniref:Ubiquitin-like domain-containing protein n=1 Tax=Blattamonas nauphoetae TaxID=2049346 RepID=A0ABQ9YFE1_9EUKA|nr:hypothetical protein BLNAU_2725 [Blattamonas nauphoetae]